MLETCAQYVGATEAAAADNNMMRQPRLVAPLLTIWALGLLYLLLSSSSPAPGGCEEACDVGALKRRLDGAAQTLKELRQQNVELARMVAEQRDFGEAERAGAGEVVFSRGVKPSVVSM